MTQKQKAQKSAKKDGVTLTFLITQFLRAYTEGKIKFELISDTNHEYEQLSKKLTALATSKIDAKTLPSLEGQLSDT